MNQEKVENILLKVIKVGIFTTLLTPLVMGPFGINFVEYPKAVFFRSLIEIIFACYISLFLLNKKYLPKKSIILASLLFFYTVMFVASIFGINFYRSFFGDMPRGEGLIMHLHLLAFFIIITSIFLKREEWLNFFKVSVLISGLSSIVALLQQMKIARFYTMYGDGTRVSGTLSNPDLFGCYMTLSVFITIFILFLERNKNFKILWLFFIALNTYTLFFSGTRGAWLGFIFGIAALILFNFSNLDYKKRNIVFIGILAIAGFVIFVNLNSSWIGNIPGGEVLERITSTGLSGRTEIWGPTSVAIKERPVLGWGFESFAFVSDKYMTGLSNGVYFDRAHNKILEILIYGGIIGFLSYLLVFVAIFYSVFKYAKFFDGNNRPKVIYISILLSFFVTYFVQNIFSFDNIGTYVLFFLVAGFINNSFSNQKVPVDEDGFLNDKKYNSTFPLKIVAIFIVFFITIVIFYEVNLRPTSAAMYFSGFIAYEQADVERALYGYRKGISMNTVYDSDLRMTFTDRLLYIMNKEDSNDIKESIYNDLLKMKPFFYKSIAENDEQINHLYQFLARISEQGYILHKNLDDLKEMDQVLQKATLFNPNVSATNQLIGELKILQSDYSDGEKYLKKGCILENCDDFELYQIIAQAYLKKGDTNLALKNFEKIIDINYENKKQTPESVEVSMSNVKFIDYVGSMYCKKLNDIQNCKRIYEKGSSIYPEYLAMFKQRFKALTQGSEY